MKALVWRTPRVSVFSKSIWLEIGGTKASTIVISIPCGTAAVRSTLGLGDGGSFGFITARSTLLPGSTRHRARPVFFLCTRWPTIMLTIISVPRTKPTTRPIMRPVFLQTVASEYFPLFVVVSRADRGEDERPLMLTEETYILEMALGLDRRVETACAMALEEPPTWNKATTLPAEKWARCDDWLVTNFLTTHLLVEQYRWRAAFQCSANSCRSWLVAVQADH